MSTNRAAGGQTKSARVSAMPLRVRGSAPAFRADAGVVVGGGSVGAKVWLCVRALTVILVVSPYDVDEVVV